MADPQINLGDLGTLDSFFDLFKQLTDHLNKHVATITKKIQNVTNIMDQGARATNVSTIENNINKVNTKLKAFNTQVQKIVQDAYNQVDTLEKTVKNVTPTGGTINIKAKFTEVSNRLSKTLATRTEELFKNVTKEIESSLGATPAGQQFSSQAIKETTTKPLEKALQDKLTKTIDVSIKRYKESLNKVAGEINSAPVSVQDASFTSAQTAGYVESEGKFIEKITTLSKKRVNQFLVDRNNAINRTIADLPDEKKVYEFPYKKLSAGLLSKSEDDIYKEIIRRAKKAPLPIPQFFKDRYGVGAKKEFDAILNRGNRLHSELQGLALQGWRPRGLEGFDLAEIEKPVADVENKINGSIDLLFKNQDKYVATEIKSISSQKFSKLQKIIQENKGLSKGKLLAKVLDANLINDQVKSAQSQLDSYTTSLAKEFNRPFEQIGKQIDGVIQIVSEGGTGGRAQVLQLPWQYDLERHKKALKRGRAASVRAEKELANDLTIKKTVSSVESWSNSLELMHKSFIEGRTKLQQAPLGPSQGDLQQVTDLSAKLKNTYALIAAKRGSYGAGKFQQGNIAKQAINAIASMNQVNDIYTTVDAYSQSMVEKTKYFKEIENIAKGAAIKPLQAGPKGTIDKSSLTNQVQSIDAFIKARQAREEMQKSVRQFVDLTLKQKGTFKDPALGIEAAAKNYSQIQAQYQQMIDAYGDPESLGKLQNFVGKAQAGKGPEKVSIKFPESKQVRADISGQLQKLGTEYTSFIESYYDVRRQRMDSTLHIIKEDFSNFSNLKTEAERQTAVATRFAQASSGGIGVVSQPIGMTSQGILEGGNVLQQSMQGLNEAISLYMRTGRDILQHSDKRISGAQEQINAAFQKRTGVTLEGIKAIGSSTGEGQVAQTGFVGGYVKGGDTALAIDASKVGLGENFVPQVEKEMSKEFSSSGRDALQDMLMNPKTGIISGMFNRQFDQIAETLNFKDMFKQMKHGKGSLYKTKTAQIANVGALKEHVKVQMLEQISSKVEKVIYASTSQGGVFQGNIEEFLKEIINKNILKGSGSVPNQIADYLKESLSGVVDLKSLHVSHITKPGIISGAPIKSKIDENALKKISAVQDTDLASVRRGVVGASGIEGELSVAQDLLGKKAYALDTIAKSQDTNLKGIRDSIQQYNTQFQKVLKATSKVYGAQDIKGTPTVALSTVYEEETARSAGDLRLAGETISKTIDLGKGSYTKIQAEKGQSSKALDEFWTNLSKTAVKELTEAREHGLKLTQNQIESMVGDFSKKAITLTERRGLGIYDRGKALRVETGEGGRSRFSTDEFVNRAYTQVRAALQDLVAGKGVQKGGEISKVTGGLHPSQQPLGIGKDFYDKRGIGFQEGISSIGAGGIVGKDTKALLDTESVLSKSINQFIAEAREYIQKVIEIDPKTGQIQGLKTDKTTGQPFFGNISELVSSLPKELQSIVAGIKAKQKPSIKEGFKGYSDKEVNKFSNIFKDLKSGLVYLKESLVGISEQASTQKPAEGFSYLVKELDVALGSMGKDLVKYSKEGEVSFGKDKVQVPKELSSVINKFVGTDLKAFHSQYAKMIKKADPATDSGKLQTASTEFVGKIQGLLNQLVSKFGFGEQQEFTSMSSQLDVLSQAIGKDWAAMIQSASRVGVKKGTKVDIKDLIRTNFSQIEKRVNKYVSSGVEYKNAVMKAISNTFMGQFDLPPNLIEEYGKGHLTKVEKGRLAVPKAEAVNALKKELNISSKKALEQVNALIKSTKSNKLLTGIRDQIQAQLGLDPKMIEQAIRGFTGIRAETLGRPAAKKLDTSFLKKMNPQALMQNVLTSYYQKAGTPEEMLYKMFGESPVNIAKQLSGQEKGVDPTQLRDELIKNYAKGLREAGFKLSKAAMLALTEKMQGFFNSILPGSFVDVIGDVAKTAQSGLQSQFNTYGASLPQGVLPKDFARKASDLYSYKNIKPPKPRTDIDVPVQADFKQAEKDAVGKYKEEQESVKGTAQEVRNLTDLLQNKINVIGLESDKLKEEPGIIKSATEEAAKLEKGFRDGFTSVEAFDRGLTTTHKSLSALIQSTPGLVSEIPTKEGAAKFEATIASPIEARIKDLTGAFKNIFSSVKPSATGINVLLEKFNQIKAAGDALKGTWKEVTTAGQKKGIIGLEQRDMFGDKEKDNLQGYSKELDNVSAKITEIYKRAKVPLSKTKEGFIPGIAEGKTEQEALKHNKEISKVMTQMVGTKELELNTQKEIEAGSKPYEANLKKIQSYYSTIYKESRNLNVTLGERLSATVQAKNVLSAYSKEYKTMLKAGKSGIPIDTMISAKYKSTLNQMKSDLKSQTSSLQNMMSVSGDPSALGMLKEQASMEEQVNVFKERGIKLQGQLVQFNKAFPDMKRKELLIAAKITDQYGKQVGSLEQLVRVQGKNSMYLKDQVKGLYAGGPAQIMGNVMKRMAMYSGGGFAYFGILRLVKSIIKTITDVELGMMKLRQIMDHTTTDFRGMITAAVGISKAYGTELTKVVDVMNDYARMGLKAAEVTKMTEIAVMGVNVGFKDTRTAMDYLTSMIKQYNMEVARSIDILDMLVEVADRNATTVEDLGQAFKHVGAAAFAAGVKIEELIAMIATLEANTRLRGSMIGRALRRIISRVHSEEAVSMLENMGVAVYDVSGQYRSFTTILGDVADRWVTLTNVQQENLARQIAQQRYYNFFIVLMNKWNQTMASVNQAQNAQGAAMRKNAEIMQSLAKHTAVTKQLFAEFAVTLGDAGILRTLKGVQDAVQLFASGLSVIPGPLKTILGLVIGIKVIQMGLNWQLRLFTGKGLGDWLLKLKGIIGLTGVQSIKQQGMLAQAVKQAALENEIAVAKKRSVGVAVASIKISKAELTIRQLALKTELGISAARAKQMAMTAGPAVASTASLAAVHTAGMATYGGAAVKQAAAGKAGIVGSKGIMATLTSTTAAAAAATAAIAVAAVGTIIYFSYKKASKSLKDIQKETQGTISFVTKRILDAQSAIQSIQDIRGASGSGNIKEIQALEKQNKLINDVALKYPKLIRGFDDYGNAILRTKGNVNALNYELDNLISEHADLQLDLRLGRVSEMAKALTNARSFWGWVSRIFGGDDSMLATLKKTTKEVEVLKNKLDSALTITDKQNIWGEWSKAATKLSKLQNQLNDQLEATDSEFRVLGKLGANSLLQGIGKIGESLKFDDGIKSIYDMKKAFFASADGLTEIQKQAFATRALLLPLFESIGNDITEIFLGSIDAVVQGLQVKHFKQFAKKFKIAIESINIGRDIKDEINAGIQEALSQGKSSIDLTKLFGKIDKSKLLPLFKQMGKQELAFATDVGQEQGPALKQTLAFAKDYVIIRDETLKKEDDRIKQLKITKDNLQEILDAINKINKAEGRKIQLAVDKTSLDALSTSLLSLNKQWESFLKPIKSTFALLTKMGIYYNRLAKIQQTTIQIGEYGWRDQIKALEDMALSSMRVYGSMSGIFGSLERDIRENFRNMQKVHDMSARIHLIRYGLGARDRIRGKGFNKETEQDVKIITALANRSGEQTYEKEARVTEGNIEAGTQVMNRLLNEQAGLYDKAEAEASKYGRTLLDITYNGMQQGVYLTNAYTDQINMIDTLIQKTEKLFNISGGRIGVGGIDMGLRGGAGVSVKFSDASRALRRKALEEGKDITGGDPEILDQLNSLQAYQNRISKALYKTEGEPVDRIQILGREIEEYIPELDKFIKKLDESGNSIGKNTEKYKALKEMLVATREGYKGLADASAKAGKIVGDTLYTEAFINRLKGDVLYNKIHTELKKNKINLGDSLFDKAINAVPILKGVQDMAINIRKTFSGRTLFSKDSFGLNVLLSEMMATGKQYAKLMSDLETQTATATTRMMSATAPMEQLYHAMTVTSKQAQSEYARTMKGLNVFTVIEAEFKQDYTKNLLKKIVDTSDPDQLRKDILKVFEGVTLPQEMEAWKTQLKTDPKLIADVKAVGADLYNATQDAGGDLDAGKKKLNSKAQETMAKVFQNNQGFLISVQEQLLKGVEGFQQYAQGAGGIFRKQLSKVYSLEGAQELYATVTASADKVAKELTKQLDHAHAGEIENIKTAIYDNVANAYMFSAKQVSDIVAPLVRSLNISKYLVGEKPYEKAAGQFKEMFKQIVALKDIDLNTPLDKLSIAGESSIKMLEDIKKSYGDIMTIGQATLGFKDVKKGLMSLKEEPGKEVSSSREKQLKKDILTLQSLEKKLQKSVMIGVGPGYQPKRVEETEKEYYGIINKDMEKAKKSGILHALSFKESWLGALRPVQRSIKGFEAQLKVITSAKVVSKLGFGDLLEDVDMSKQVGSIIDKALKGHTTDPKKAKDYFMKTFSDAISGTDYKKLLKKGNINKIWEFISNSAKAAKMTEAIIDVEGMKLVIKKAFDPFRVNMQLQAASTGQIFNEALSLYSSSFKKMWGLYRDGGIDSSKEVATHITGSMKTAIKSIEGMHSAVSVMVDRLPDKYQFLKGTTGDSLDLGLDQLIKMKKLLQEVEDASKMSDTWDKLRKSINIVNAEVQIFGKEFVVLDKTLGYVRSTLDDILKTAIEDGNKTLDEVLDSQRAIIDALSVYYNYLESLNDVYKSQVKGIDAMADSWKKVGAGAKDAESPIYSFYKAMKEERFGQQIDSIADRMKAVLGQITPFEGIDEISKRGQEQNISQMNTAYTKFDVAIDKFVKAVDLLTELQDKPSKIMDSGFSGFKLTDPLVIDPVIIKQLALLKLPKLQIELNIPEAVKKIYSTLEELMVSDANIPSATLSGFSLTGKGLTGSVADRLKFDTRGLAGGGKVDAPAGADMYSAKLSGQEMVLNPTQQMALEKSYPGASKYLEDMLPKWSPTGYAAGGLGSKKELDVKPVFDVELLAMFHKEVNHRINDLTKPINFKEKSSNASDYLTDASFFSKFAVDMPGLTQAEGYAKYKKLLRSNASSYLDDFSYLNKSLGANVLSGDTKKAQKIAEYIHNYYAKGIYHNPGIINLPELDGLDAVFTQYLVLRNQAGLKDFGIPQKKQETWKDVLNRKLAGFKELHRTGDISAGVFKRGEQQHIADRNIPKFKLGGRFGAPETGQDEMTYKNVQQVGKRVAIKSHWTLQDVFDYLAKKDEETGDSMSARNLILFSKFMSMIETGGAKLKPGIMQGAEYIKSAAGRGVAYAKEKFKGERRHQFGAVSGDEYPAYLHKGEVVLPEHMVYALNAANPGVFDGLQRVGAGPKSTPGSHEGGGIVTPGVTLAGISALYKKAKPSIPKEADKLVDPGFWAALGNGFKAFGSGLVGATTDLSQFGTTNKKVIEAQEKLIFELRKDKAKKDDIEIPTAYMTFEEAKSKAEAGDPAIKEELKVINERATKVAAKDTGAEGLGKLVGSTMQMAVLSGIESMIRSPEFGTQGMSLGDVTSGDQKFKKVDPALSKAMKQTMEVATVVGGTAGQALGAATGIPGLDKVGQVLGEKLGALVGKWMTPKAVEDMAKAMDKFRKASLNAEAQLILMNFSIDTSSKVFSLINDTLTKATQEISNALSNFGNGLKDGTIRFLDVLDVYDSTTASVSVGFNKVMDDISANSGKLTAKADTVTSSDMSVFGAVSEFFGTDVELTDMTPVYQELSDKIVAIGDATDDWFIGLKDNNSFMQILGGTFSGTGDILSQFGQALVGATEEIQMFTDVAVGGGVSEGQKLNLDAIRAPYIARLKGISTQMDTLDSQMGMFGGMADAAADAMDSFGKLDVTGKDETGVSAVVDAVGDFFFGTADEEQALLDQQNAQLEALALQTENEAAKLDIQTKQLELAKESAEIAEEMLSSLSDFITQINDSRMAASEQRKGWEYISGVVNGAGTDLTNFMDGLTGTGVTASSIISAAFGNTQATLMAEKVRSSRFATREEIESGAKGVTGQVYNKDGTVDVTKSLSVAKIQDYSSLASATGELVALSGEQITYLTSIAPEVASQVANMSVQELYYAVRDYQIDQGKKIADIYSRTNETIVEIAVTGYDNMLMTTSKYMSMMADTITRWSDENKFETEAIKTAIDEFSTQAEYIDPTAFMTTLGTNLGSSTASAFDTFNNMAKDTMPLLEEGAHGFLEITDTAKSFYSNQLQNMNTYINSLKSEKGINAALLRKQLDSFATGGAAGAGFTGGALTGSQLAALESNLGDDPIQRAAQMDTLMRLNDELVRIDSDILDKQNEAVDFARESTELLNKIQEDYAKSFGQPELEKQFIEMNLRLLRNMQHAVDPESGRLFMTEQGDLNRISMAENTALKNLGQGQFDVATTLEDFDQKYGAKIAGEGPRDVSTWTEVRPITNNIDIHLDMDFLDPSQLDTDRQRSIAIMVRDSLIDESARFSS